jgi:hypothetical protein
MSVGPISNNAHNQGHYTQGLVPKCQGKKIVTNEPFFYFKGAFTPT